MRLKNRLLTAVPRPIRHVLIDRFITRQRAQLTHGIPTDPVFLARNSVASPIEFWQRPATENAPATYASSGIRWDIDWLKDRIDALCPGGTVLDFGCNAGRALHVFAEAGYHCIGVELNPAAVELGKRTFPSLKNVHFHTGDGALREVSVPVDVIYSCAVLRHVSPDKIGGVFAEFGRIKPRYIITLEDEGGCDVLNFPHDYTAHLADIGYRETHRSYAIDIHPDIDIGGIGTMFRVYAR